MFKNSYLKISPHRLSITVPKILINDIEFSFSTWEFYDIDMIMNNCNTSLLSLNVNLCERNFNSTNVTSTVNIYNCTLGCWTFQCINNVQISDCSIIGNPSAYNKIILNFTYSTAVLDKILIKELNFDCSDREICGLFFDESKVLIKNTFYERNINASIWVINHSRLEMKNCTILDNDVLNGVIYGGISLLYITDSTFENNTMYNGGAVYINMYSVVLVDSCTFTNNLGLGVGGGVTVIGNSTLVIRNSVFTNNTAWMAGGGVYVSRYTRLDVSRSIFDGNTAYFDGGGILAGENSSVIFTSSIFINNRPTTMTGSAISIYSSNATLSNLMITQNGGSCAFFFHMGYFVNIRNCIFYKNTNRPLCVSAVTETTVLNCDFLDNEAVTGGAILAQYSETFIVYNVQFFQNVANSGGAIVIFLSNMYIYNCII